MELRGVPQAGKDDEETLELAGSWAGFTGAGFVLQQFHSARSTSLALFDCLMNFGDEDPLFSFLLFIYSFCFLYLKKFWSLI